MSNPSKFNLQSKFSPTGDQPEAIKKLTVNLKKGLKHQTLLGVTGSGKTFTVANIINNIQKPTLVIAHNKTLAAQLADEFRKYFPNNAVHYFVSYYDYYQPEAYIPQTDTYIEKDSSINDEIDRLRHAATHALLTRNDVIIVASVSCIYGIGSPEFYKSLNFTFKIGNKIKRDIFLNKLTDQQYVRNDLELKRGAYRIKGDVLEIFPAYGQSVFKIEFFGDVIENISELNWMTGKVIMRHKEFEVYPARHFVVPDKLHKNAIIKIRKDLKNRLKHLKDNNKFVEHQRLKERTEHDLEMIKTTGYCSGIENYSRYFEGRKPGKPPSVLIDYFPKDYLLIIDESHITVPQIRGMYAGDLARKEKLVNYGFRLPSAIDNRPLKYDEFYNKIHQAIFTSATPTNYELKLSKKVGLVEQLIRPTGLLDPKIEIRKTAGQVKNLISEIEIVVKNRQRILVTTLTKKMAEELTDYLKDRKIKVQYLHSDVETLKRSEILHSLRLGEFDVLVGINLLREGLDLPEVSLVVIFDADKEGFLRSHVSLIQTIGRAARHKDGRVIMYADNITKSMKYAMEETERRQKFQEKYNLKHNITPQSIKKKIKSKEKRNEGKLKIIDKTFSRLSKQEKLSTIKNLNKVMLEAAKNLKFEKATELRDEISRLEEHLHKL